MERFCPAINATGCIGGRLKAIAFHRSGDCSCPLKFDMFNPDNQKLAEKFGRYNWQKRPMERMGATSQISYKSRARLEALYAAKA